VGLAASASYPGTIPSLPDSRVLRVDAFFESFDCPRPNHAAEYVRVADRYHLDYRILPAISVLESTCGSAQRLNNHWGWNSARTGFPSVAHGIDYVTRQLAAGEPYKSRDLDGKLFTYNPRPAYVRAARRLIARIG
jgi:hypothetical protein